jgi:hypothetical protein
VVAALIFFVLFCFCGKERESFGKVGHVKWEIPNRN